jgi:pilus assembly protein CpaE
METVAEPLRILCLSRDPTIAAGVAAMLASVPDLVLATRTADYDEGLRDLREPDLAFVVLEEDPAAGIAVLEDVRRRSQPTHLVAVSLDDDAETIVRAMRAGADQHLSLPLSQQELFKACIKVIELRRSRPAKEAAKDAAHGELWVAYGPKGGVGVTTLVVNLAIALQTAQRDVAIVDLDVYAGDAAFFLDVKPAYTLRQVAGAEHLDPVFLRGAMTRHRSGVPILAAPAAAGDGAPLEISAARTLAILELVTGMHELTLVDTPGIPSESTRAALGAADRILLVTDLTVPALHGCMRTLDWLRGDGVDVESTVDVIVNKNDSRGSKITPKEASRTLGLPLRAVLPRDDGTALGAANAGKPLAEVKPGGTLERAIAELAGPTQPDAAAGQRRAGFLRLFS